MPRRPSKGRSNRGKPRGLNRADAKIKKWDKPSDVPMDEEDLFHASRDKVLVDGDDYHQEDDGDEDEVFTLKGLEDEDYEGAEDVEMRSDDEIVQDREKILTKSTKAQKSKKRKKAPESSEGEQSESEEETWGRGKAAYYASNAAELESDDEEGNELEEQEARRLQAKWREGMGDEDFGLNDDVDIESSGAKDEFADPVPTVVSLSHDKNLLIRHLEKTSPEALALARDWEDIAHKIMATREKLTNMLSENSSNPILSMLHLFYQTLLTYGTTLAFYLHLRASEKYAHKPELLKSHPIMGRLLTLKQSLSTLDDLDLAFSDSEDEDEDEDSMTWNDMLMDGESVWDMNGGLEEDELQDLLADAGPQCQEIAAAPPHETKSKKPPKKKRKLSPKAKPLTPVFDLVEPEFQASQSSSALNPSFAQIDVYGEAASLQYADAADKSARKKSLRFHTSKIESASARRQGARNKAMGGDDDIPYRERRKEKEARLAKEAAAKGRRQGGQDLDDSEPKPRLQEEDDEQEIPDGYYELVKKRTKERKEDKKTEYEGAHTRPDLDEDGSTGPRFLTRAILTNKGLTPHRPKSVRNPRVKKRVKFEKAKKKLSSQKAVFKGGLAETGRYDGEKSGISKVVKSIPLC